MWYATDIGTDIAVARDFLIKGETVGIPTETVYGLAANALNEEAVLKIFSAKNRPHFDPLIVHAARVSDIEKYVQDIPAKARLLMQAFMPGPLTLLLPKKKIIPDLVTSGSDTVAIRVPQHPLTSALLQQLDFPLAAPSANPFGYISPTSAYHVYDQLHGRIPYILDGGPTQVGVESTIVGMEGEDTVIYRLGGLPQEEIEKVVGHTRPHLNESSDPRSPGMLTSHYAPRKKLVVLPSGNTTPVLSARAGFIGFDKPDQRFDQRYQILLSEKGSLKEAAKNLFAAMRQLDASEVEQIYAVQFPDTGLGKAINDRLKRAAAG